MLLTGHPLAAQDFQCSRDAVADQVIALASRAVDPAALLFAWLRLANQREAAGASVPEAWEAFCLGVLASEQAGVEPSTTLAPPAASLPAAGEFGRRGTPTAVPGRSGSFTVGVEALRPTSLTSFVPTPLPTIAPLGAG